jgi:hypothetical protein
VYQPILRPDNVPAVLIALLPFAQRWGVNDDGDRAAMIDAASRLDLEAIVRAVDSANDEALEDWLAGPASHAAKPSAEYVAFTCLIMAADQARLILQQG